MSLIVINVINYVDHNSIVINIIDHIDHIDYIDYNICDIWLQFITIDHNWLHSTPTII